MIIWPLSLVLTLAYGALRWRTASQYRRLENQLGALTGRYGDAFARPLPRDPPGLPFTRIAVLPEAVPSTAFALLRQAAERIADRERSFIPGHKQGGTVAYATLQRLAPEIVAFYHSRGLRELCAHLIGETVGPTPLNDQSSCSLLIYERPRDHIGWHYDHNFYRGRHFTVLVPLINRHRHLEQLSSANLEIRAAGADRVVLTPANTLVLFEGAKVRHRVTRLGKDELRIVLSMTFCTDPRSSLLQGALRRCKDVAYFGVRALWS